MGRATYDSIGRPLPGRTTIVLTRDPELARRRRAGRPRPRRRPRHRRHPARRRDDRRRCSGVRRGASARRRAGPRPRSTRRRRATRSTPTSTARSGPRPGVSTTKDTTASGGHADAGRLPVRRARRPGLLRVRPPAVHAPARASGRTLALEARQEAPGRVRLRPTGPTVGRARDREHPDPGGHPASPGQRCLLSVPRRGHRSRHVRPASVPVEPRVRRDGSPARDGSRRARPDHAAVVRAARER